MVEYSGMSFAMFFLAEYANMILVSTLAVDDVPRRLDGADLAVAVRHADARLARRFDVVLELVLAVREDLRVVTVFLWVRATFPRFRYDQIMRLGWKIFIPVTLVWLVVVGVWIRRPGTSGSRPIMATATPIKRFPLELHAHRAASRACA